MRWQKKLNKTDLKHLREVGTTTLAGVKRNVEHQAKMAFPCWDCVNIGHKLGIKMELTAFHEFHQGK